MPASICCTNCKTKYNLLNREAGCSNCALSFCRKCLSYRAIIPSLSDKPLTVCYDCYKKVEANKTRSDVYITSLPIGSKDGSTSKETKNWWGDGLPPPSFRHAYSNKNVGNSKSNTINSTTKPEDDDMGNLEERRKNLRNSSLDSSHLNEQEIVSNIEERLARLRGVDVEVIRNPRSWFHTNEGKFECNANNVDELMKMAEERARLENRIEKDEQNDIEELERRRRLLLEQENESSRNEKDSINLLPNRESMISQSSELSTVTKEQLDEINKVLATAEENVEKNKKQEDIDASELRTLMSQTRQKSLDAMQWNDQISKEIGGFWDKQCKKYGDDDNNDEDDKSDELDEETFRKIIHEAENAEIDVKNETNPSNSTSDERSTISPKKKGFFGKIFRRNS